jgi:HlyD family secretion protein
MTFKAVIDLKQQALQTNGVRCPLAAGMQRGAEIVEGKRMVLEYLLSPIHRVADEAGRER